MNIMKTTVLLLLATSMLLGGFVTSPRLAAAEPPPFCDELITGGGWIAKAVAFPIFPSLTVIDRKTHFAIQAGIADGEAFGHVNFVDPRQRLHLNTRNLQQYIVQGPVSRLLIFGIATAVNGVIANEAWVFVSDKGEPGVSDTFEIQLKSNGNIVYWASGSETWNGLGGARPGGGNIQFHVFDCE
jgi:hypothetical protein